MAVDYGLTVGPLLIGVIMNAFIFGACGFQLVNYFTSGYRDSWFIVCLLIWVGIVDTFQVAISVSMIWHYVVTNFANPAALATVPWTYATLPIFNALSSVPIQMFMAYRIMRLSKRRSLFALVAVLSLAAAALGCASAVQGLRFTSVASHVSIIPLADAWLACSVACDVAITTLVLYFLTKNRTGFQHTDSIITRICRTTVEAAVPVTLLCILDLAFLTTLPANNLHFMFALPVGRLYTNTVLCTLNERRRLRAASESGSSNRQGISLNAVTSANRFQRAPAQIRIDVERATATDARTPVTVSVPELRFTPTHAEEYVDNDNDTDTVKVGSVEAKHVLDSDSEKDVREDMEKGQGNAY